MDHLSLLEREVEATAAALAGSDPEAPVPACPGWTVRDVAQHVTTLHRWVRLALDSCEMPPFKEVAAEPDAAAIAAAYADSGADMLARMRELPVDHSCWTFDKTNPTAGFWHRRQLHELSIHRFDITPYTLADDVASDGIDEALDFLLARMLHTGRATLPEGALQLVSDDRTWSIGEGEPVAVAQGSAADLLLSLWGRGDLLPAPWSTAKLMP